MSAGDVTVLGPYRFDETGTAGPALQGIQSGAATDQIFTISDNNTFFIFWVEGA